jgi:DNA invertase Pin-like site-specific DNA recombinase
MVTVSTFLSDNFLMSVFRLSIFSWVYFSVIFMDECPRSVSELEKSFITMRLSGGRINKAWKGGYGGGCPAMGYRATNKELTIDSKSAETVKTIFSLRNERKMTLRAIAGYLNDSETATARGRKWYAGTVKYILDNCIYQGVVRYAGEQVNKAELTLV